MAEMKIESFDVGSDRKVILHMSGMPKGMTTDNTSISIAGTAQDAPDMVSVSAQQIGFTASRDAQKGKIGVLADLDGLCPDHDRDFRQKPVGC